METRMGDDMKAYRILVKKPFGNREQVERITSETLRDIGSKK
jgi:hypothetical protein